VLVDEVGAGDKGRWVRQDGDVLVDEVGAGDEGRWVRQHGDVLVDEGCAGDEGWWVRRAELKKGAGVGDEVMLGCNVGPIKHESRGLWD
jgi:hypothetical protein